jgi:hypothetical protein
MDMHDRNLFAEIKKMLSEDHTQADIEKLSVSELKKLHKEYTEKGTDEAKKEADMIAAEIDRRGEDDAPETKNIEQQNEELLMILDVLCEMVGFDVQTLVEETIKDMENMAKAHEWDRPAPEGAAAASDRLAGVKARMALLGKRSERVPPKEPTYNARVKSGELTPPLPKKTKTKKTKKPARKGKGSFPVVTNNIHHDQVTMKRLKDDPDELRTTIKEYTPGFMKHSDALTKDLRGYHESAGSGASNYERGLYAHRVITKHLDTVANKISGLKGLPIKKKFGKASISHFTQDTSWPGERSLKIHFKPLKTHVAHTGELKELTDHLEKHTGHAWYLHPDSGTQMVGKKHSPLVLATSVNHPWLRGDDGGGDDDKEPETPKPKNPKGKQPTEPKAPTRPRTPALV